ncbi:MAG TPA: SusC/RagA family TonB-linked outer membrane protein, partial [Sediminibacterium sp.]|nr:SusC/RagA family TonB-linked outer membrane protein [Sediminibacterium sp.]
TATVTPNVLPDSLPSGLGLANAGPITTAKNTLLAQYPTTNRNDDIRMTARAIAKPVKGLTITGEYTYDNLRNQVNTYDKQISNLISTYTLVLGTTGTGMYTQSQSATDYQALNLYATYNHKLGNDHNFSLMAGFNQEQSDNKTSRLSATGMYDADHPAIATATGTVTGSDTYDQYSNQGVFGRLNYDYKSKYLVEFDGRYDGSSKFPDGHRWGFFPSVSGAWRVTEEKFMAAVKPVLNEFKLRASFGSVGNQNIPDYSYYSSMYAYNPYWLMGGIPVLSLSSPSLISSSFTWETVRTLDFGLNWGMFDNRLTGVFDWYQRDTKDILTSAPVPLPATLGTGAPLQNSGALRTKGIELGLNWKDKIGKVSYSIGVNLYNYQSVVTNAVNPNKVLSNLYIGEKMGDIWGYVTDRLYTTDDFTAPSAGWAANNYTGGTLKASVPRFSGQSPNPGDVLYKKFDTTNQYLSAGAGTLDNPGDKRIIGNSNPQYHYGITGSVAYKNFDFSFVINGVLKQDLWLSNGLTFPNSYQSYSQIYTNELNYWTPNNLDAYYGRIYYQNGNQSNNQLLQSRYILNGSFMRMRNMTLRYTVPANALKKYHINRLQVFYSIENAFEFNHLPKGVYADVANQGGGNGSGQGYPFMRKSSVGINLSF